MKRKLFRLLQKYLFKIGVFTHYYPNKKEIIRSLKSYPVDIQKYELRKLSITFKTIDNHQFYNYFLKTFIPSWNEKEIKGNKIFGGGGGSGSLNSFRQVTVNKKDILRRFISRLKKNCKL